jgi:hypothetical protein
MNARNGKTVNSIILFGKIKKIIRVVQRGVNPPSDRRVEHAVVDFRLFACHNYFHPSAGRDAMAEWGRWEEGWKRHPYK